LGHLLQFWVLSDSILPDLCQLRLFPRYDFCDSSRNKIASRFLLILRGVFLHLDQEFGLNLLLVVFLGVFVYQIVAESFLCHALASVWEELLDVVHRDIDVVELTHGHVRPAFGGPVTVFDPGKRFKLESFDVAVVLVGVHWLVHQDFHARDFLVGISLHIVLIDFVAFLVSA
jgi:hypothetical protein